MKKLITILLSVAMLATLCVPAFAADYKSGSGSTTNVSLKYQSDVTPEDDEPDSKPEQKQDEETGEDVPAGPVSGTYCIAIPANICMDQYVKTVNGAVYLSGEGTVRCLSSEEGTGLDNNTVIYLSVSSENDCKIMDGETELCTYEMSFGSNEGTGINVIPDAKIGHVANIYTKAFATESTMTVNLTAVDSNIYGNVETATGDTLTWDYGTNVPAEITMINY